MNRDELLNKLAIELESWPDFQEGQAPPPNTHGIWGTHYGTWECFAKGNTNPILYGHWLQRRAELINCPLDDEAPSWATHKYQGPTGFWYWSSCALSLTDDAALWQSSGGSVLIAKRGRIISGHDWRTTLTEVNQSTCTAEEDAAWQEKEAQLNGANAEVWSGPVCGLPPKDTECEVKLTHGKFVKCKVLYSGKEVAVLDIDGEERTAGLNDQFRTILTPEQRADADTIEAMLEVAIAESKAVGCRGAVKVIYAAIKAGRIPGVVLGGGHE